MKMVRNSIRQSKENYLSIGDLEKEIHDQDYGTGSAPNQYSSSTFDMMNTLMMNTLNFQMLMIQQQLQGMSAERLSGHQERFGHHDERNFKISRHFL